MDSGYLGPGENHAQALEDDFDLMRELAPEEVLGIMDELLCHEVGLTWSSYSRCSTRTNRVNVMADGMAHGSPPFPDPFHFFIPR